MTYYLDLWQYIAIGGGPFLALWWALFASPGAKNAEERRQAALARQAARPPLTESDPLAQRPSFRVAAGDTQCANL